MTPQRIQRKRAAGWRMPEGAVYVGRPTRWGNPFSYRDRSRGLVRYGPQHLERFGRAWDYEGRCSGPGISHHMWFSADDVVETYVRWATREEIVELYRLTLLAPTPGMLAAAPSRRGRFVEATVAEIRAELAGRDLACSCPLDAPCHADVLIEIANQPADTTQETPDALAEHPRPDIPLAQVPAPVRPANCPVDARPHHTNHRRSVVVALPHPHRTSPRHHRGETPDA